MTPEFGPDGYLQCRALHPNARRRSLGGQPLDRPETARTFQRHFHNHPPRHESRPALLENIRAAARPAARAILTRCLPPPTPTRRSMLSRTRKSSTRSGFHSVMSPSFRSPATSSASISAASRSRDARQGRRAVRVLSRTCRHRGMDVMPSGFGHPDEGNKRVILCPYHLWSYDLDGKLVGAPEMQQAEGFDRSEVCLHEFRSEIWEGFVFVNLSGDMRRRWRTSSRELKEQLHRQVAHGRGRSRLVRPLGLPVQLEDPRRKFHGVLSPPRRAPEDTGALPPGQGLLDGALRPGFLLPCTCRSRTACKTESARPATPSTAFPVFPGLGLDDCLEWSIYLGYPNCLLFNAPDRVYWYRILPTGPDNQQPHHHHAHPSRTPRPCRTTRQSSSGRSRPASHFHLEDMEMCTATQRGMKSAGYAQGRLSHLEETIWQLQKYLAAVIHRSA